MLTFKISENTTEKKIRLIWLHGWGLDHKSLVPIASYFGEFENILVDFKGFGASKEPETEYGVPDYANDVLKLISSFNDDMDTFLIGHSFGGRVAIEIAANHKDKVKGIILVASAGLMKKRSFLFKIKAKVIRAISKIFPNKFNLGSADYQKTKGVMRKTFVKVINHNQEEMAKQIDCKTLLIYGEDDTETPKEFGERFNKLIKNSRLFIIKKQGHNSVLTSGRYQVQNIIETFFQSYN
ncbi:MAG: 2-hydroxy-6-oxo-6-(2'-aminophenyl)hexa-2,4-dienoic acid hydrolase [Alphaproteobacteria bacterium ADurb.Bin438]|nr:MAG: 2-hydroxy-6-oxo-6-(2'-aminophenyl)hexa-2,4-dienoic acid hydrolase [Alphaproteobacteria bacterium ADurb.Bin438]